LIRFVFAESAESEQVGSGHIPHRKSVEQSASDSRRIHHSAGRPIA